MPCNNISQFSLLSPLSVPQTDSSELLIRAENSGGGERREETPLVVSLFVKEGRGTSGPVLAQSAQTQRTVLIFSDIEQN